MKWQGNYIAYRDRDRVFDITWLLEFSSLRKSKTRLGDIGIQKEVAALRTMPGGLPGSSTLFLVITLTSSAPLPDNVVHVWAVEAPTPEQKLIIILSANFSMLFLPSGLVITNQQVINYIHKSVKSSFTFTNDNLMCFFLWSYHRLLRMGCWWPKRWLASRIVAPVSQPNVWLRIPSLSSLRLGICCVPPCHLPQHAPPI